MDDERMALDKLHVKAHTRKLNAEAHALEILNETEPTSGSTSSTWISRLKEERYRVESDARKLSEFRKSDTFSNLTDGEQRLMCDQEAVMMEYADILALRYKAITQLTGE